MDLINKPYTPFTVEFPIPTNRDELVYITKKILDTDYCPRTMEKELQYRTKLANSNRGEILESLKKDIQRLTGRKFNHGDKELVYNLYFYDLLLLYLPDVIHACYWVYDDTPQKEIDVLLQTKMDEMNVSWFWSFYNPTAKKSIPEIQHKQVFYIL
jgi:hypothetical protein